MQVSSWIVQQAASPMTREVREESPGAGEVIVQVAGCGVCHTDLGFFYDGVPTRHPFPLTLGHEISGTVVEAGAGAEAWLGPRRGRAGRDALRRVRRLPRRAAARSARSRSSRATTCTAASPATSACPPAGCARCPTWPTPPVNPGGLDLAALSVIADAVSTPYQAIVRSGLGRATWPSSSASAASAASASRSPRRSAPTSSPSTSTPIASRRWRSTAPRSRSTRPRTGCEGAAQAGARASPSEAACPPGAAKIFETSGTPAGQATAFGLLGHGGYLSVVGYTPKTVELRLSNLMAFDATAQGNWGCLPEHYPAVVDLVLHGTVALEPFVERRPLSTINDVFAELHAGRVARRLVLDPGGSSHDLQGPRPRPPAQPSRACATRTARCSIPTGDDGARAAHRADHARQPRRSSTPTPPRWSRA